MNSRILSLMTRLKLIKPEVAQSRLKQRHLMEELSSADGIIAQNKLLGKPFFYEPLRTTWAQVLGPSGLVKMKDKDNYRLALLNGKQQPTILDIGSHIGIFPRVVKEQFPDARIFSLEPDRDNFRILKLNNELLTDSKSYQYGVYEDRTMVKLKVSDQNSWRSSLAVNEGFFNSALVGNDTFSYDEYEVECISIDQFVEQEGIKELALVGITVPGEIALPMLRGAKKTLANLKPVVSLNLYTSEIKAVVELFESHGYQLKHPPIGTMHTFVSSDE